MGAGMGLLDWLFSSQVASPETGRFGRNRYKLAGEWVQTTLALPVAGLHHRRDDVLAFFSAVQKAEAKSQRYEVELCPTPTNRHDRNAIAVYGHASGRAWHLGFLDRDTAHEITRDLVSKGIPIAGELYNCWLAEDGFMSIKIIVLAPPGYSMKVRVKGS